MTVTLTGAWQKLFHDDHIGFLAQARALEQRIAEGRVPEAKRRDAASAPTSPGTCRAGIDMALGESWLLGAGYRYLDVDYDKGEGLDRRVWQIVYQGPYLFAAYSW